ncbi:MAG TPA: hypothetical protein VL485_03270 [Ktedonobacteraceae bacterium]|jgi:hypothetical protein|nr:hypothetical protein [Ktedonobacteraceae bacterium]
MRMPSFQDTEGRARARTGMGILLSLLLMTTSILTIITIQHMSVKADSNQLLPGQQIWGQGTSSLLFGANDANWQWSNNNLGNSAAIVSSIRKAGITVIRTPLSAADAQARVSAIEATGAKCLGILSPTDAEQVVKMLGDRCDMYEWMNEPDNGGPTATEYANSWNQYIPTLRSINPHAAFIGPVVASPDLPYIQQFLTLAKQAGNLPDAVSYHTYPCTDQTIASCPSHINTSYVPDAAKVRATVNSVLGYNLPLALTEWNYSWRPGQTPQSDPFMKTFTTLSINAFKQAGLAMANEYDIASNAGGGTLDMVNPQNGEAQPQLQELQQLIHNYQAQQAPPAPPVSNSPAPPVMASPTPALPTSTPITVSQPPPIVVVGAPTDMGSFIIGQQLHCEPGAPLNPQLALTQQPIDTDLLSTMGVTQDGCSLVFRVQNPQQTLRFNWWNEGIAITNKLSFLVSSNSTNGVNGTWENFPAASSIAAGGSQTVTLLNQTWVKVSVNPPRANTPPANLVMELYALSVPSSDIPSSSQPIMLPRN